MSGTHLVGSTLFLQSTTELLIEVENNTFLRNWKKKHKLLRIIFFFSPTN